MARLKEFFEMTRHERRGSIIVLALIALLLAATVAVRSCRHSAEQVQDEAVIRQFENEADTAILFAPHKKTLPKPTFNDQRKSKSKKRSRPAAPKPSHERRLDPVPQI